MAETCTSCGSALTPGASYCAHCGTVTENTTHATDVTGTIHSLGTTVADVGPIEPAQRPSDSDTERDVLVIVRGPSAGSQIELVGEEMQAGRSPEMAIFLDDITVSREHAAFAHTQSGWLLKDLGSLNGTYVNRDRIDSVQLANGDEIQIGKYRFHFLAGVSAGSD